MSDARVLIRIGIALTSSPTTRTCNRFSFHNAFGRGVYFVSGVPCEWPVQDVNRSPLTHALNAAIRAG